MPNFRSSQIYFVFLFKASLFLVRAAVIYFSVLARTTVPPSPILPAQDKVQQAAPTTQLPINAKLSQSIASVDWEAGKGRATPV